MKKHKKKRKYKMIVEQKKTNDLHKTRRQICKAFCAKKFAV